MGTASTAKIPVKKKSGLRSLKPGDILFHDGDSAKSLFIIQKGQLRLYKPKGKGFIELAVLRTGEVLGEMAYFNDDNSGGKRSCSAAALVSTDIIEISFIAFGKTMEGLNPWFKTIINTLANRLRKTNTRVKQLESNSVAVDYGTGSTSGYEFIKGNDVIKFLGTFFLVFKSHGEEHPNGIKLHRNVLNLYANEIYTLMEAKLEAMIQLLIELEYLSIEPDADNSPKILVIRSVERLRGLFIFFNTEKHLTEDKKLKITERCQKFLSQIAQQKEFEPKSSKMQVVNIQSILDDYKLKNIKVGLEILGESKEAALTNEIIVGEGNSLSVEVYPQKLVKLLPIIIFINSLRKLNDSKAAR
jgi:CRP/FNR family transcriptional regulator, cyclic AMP receptor protein